MSRAAAAQVPEQWQQQAPPGFPTASLDAWLGALAAAWEFLCAWARAGPPAEVALAGLFCPAAYLLGVQQAFAAENHVPSELTELKVQVSLAWPQLRCCS